MARPILAVVQAGTNLDHVLCQPIVDRVGKPARQHSTQIAVRDRTHLRHGDEEVEHSPKFVLKLDTEADSFALIPATGVFNIPGGTRREREAAPGGAQRRRALSSSAEIVARSVESADRRSNSSRCQSGTGRSVIEVARLSQISPTRRKRSAAGRSRISLRRAGRVISEGAAERRRLQVAGQHMTPFSNRLTRTAAPRPDPLSPPAAPECNSPTPRSPSTSLTLRQN